MVNDIRSEFEHLVSKVSWMDETTRKAALSKAKALTPHIGYPDELADIQKMEEYYKKLEVVPDNLLLNALNMSVFNTDYSYNKLHKLVNKTDWETHAKPALVNAFYSPLENSIRMFIFFLIFHRNRII